MSEGEERHEKIESVRIFTGNPESDLEIPGESIAAIGIVPVGGTTTCVVRLAMVDGRIKDFVNVGVEIEKTPSSLVIPRRVM